MSCLISALPNLNMFAESHQSACVRTTQVWNVQRAGTTSFDTQLPPVISIRSTGITTSLLTQDFQEPWCMVYSCTLGCCKLPKALQEVEP